MAGRRRFIQESDTRVVLAWQTAAMVGLAWAGKLPKLEAILKKRWNEPQQREEQVNVLHMLSARYGIPLRRTRLIQKEAQA